MGKIVVSRALALILAALLVHVKSLTQPVVDIAVDPIAVFTVQAEGQQTVVRALTHAATCPTILWNGNFAQRLTTRVFFESISFAGPHPASLVLGNAGSSNEGHVPTRLSAGTELYPGAVVQDYAARAEFGFATLDRIKGQATGRWLLTEYSELGIPLLRCTITGDKSRCTNMDKR
jgi:hypothetical protein